LAPPPPPPPRHNGLHALARDLPDRGSQLHKADCSPPNRCDERDQAMFLNKCSSPSVCRSLEVECARGDLHPHPQRQASVCIRARVVCQGGGGGGGGGGERLIKDLKRHAREQLSAPVVRNVDLNGRDVVGRSSPALRHQYHEHEKETESLKDRHARQVSVGMHNNSCNKLGAPQVFDKCCQRTRGSGPRV
jgi:hypothetical protein